MKGQMTQNREIWLPLLVGHLATCWWDMLVGQTGALLVGRPRQKRLLVLVGQMATIFWPRCPSRRGPSRPARGWSGLCLADRNTFAGVDGLTARQGQRNTLCMSHRFDRSGRIGG